MLTNKNVFNVRLTIIPLNPNLTLLTLDHNANYDTTLYSILSMHLHPIILSK